jgi:hypothetical protein
MKTKTIIISIVTIFAIPVYILQAAEVDNKILPTFRKEIRDIRREGVQDVRTIRSSASSSEKSKALRDEMKAQIEVKKIEIKKEVEEVRGAYKEAVQKRLDEKAKDRVQSRLDEIFKKITQNLNKLSKVDSEVLRRVKQISSKTDLVSAETIASLNASYTTANALLVKAKADANVTKTTIATEISTTTSKEVIRSLVAQTDLNIKNVAESYKKIIDSIKDIRKSIESATSTTTQ